MLKIGITGGIGSGKSLVCKVFEKLGVSVFHSDDIAKILLDTDEGIRAEMYNYFGEKIFNKANMIDRPALANIIFSDKIALKKTNTIVHPEVETAFNLWLEKKQNCKYILKEAAIIFESNSYKTLDKIICVTASLEERIKRITERDVVSRESILKRINMQMNEADRINKSDYIINNEEKNTILPQILKLHKQFSSF